MIHFEFYSNCWKDGLIYKHKPQFTIDSTSTVERWFGLKGQATISERWFHFNTIFPDQVLTVWKVMVDEMACPVPLGRRVSLASAALVHQGVPGWTGRKATLVCLDSMAVRVSQVSLWCILVNGQQPHCFLVPGRCWCLPSCISWSLLCFSV